MTTTSVRRPTLVTVLAVLVVISGILSILGGVVAVMAYDSVLAPGIVSIVIGLIYLGVAKGVLEGRPAARIIVAVVNAGQILLGVFTLVGTEDSAIQSSAIGSIISGVVILAVLFSPAANSFFGSRR